MQGHRSKAPPLTTWTIVWPFDQCTCTMQFIQLKIKNSDSTIIIKMNTSRLFGNCWTTGLSCFDRKLTILNGYYWDIGGKSVHPFMNNGPKQWLNGLLMRGSHALYWTSLINMGSFRCLGFCNSEINLVIQCNQWTAVLNLKEDVNVCVWILSPVLYSLYMNSNPPLNVHVISNSYLNTQLKKINRYSKLWKIISLLVSSYNRITSVLLNITYSLHKHCRSMCCWYMLFFPQQL